MAVNKIKALIAGSLYLFCISPSHAELGIAQLAQIQIDKQTKQLYSASCSMCHESGAAGAPISGDVEAWRFRIEKGLSGLVESTKKGAGRMPPMGQCTDCSDQDFESLIKFMLTKKREAL